MRHVAYISDARNTYACAILVACKLHVCGYYMIIVNNASHLPVTFF
jgi:hypothetical protein